MEGAGQQKTLAPSQTLKGREFYFYSRGATLIAFPFFQSHARSQRWRRLILHCVVDLERPLFTGYCAAWVPPTCSYLPAFEPRTGFLRPAAHEGVLRRRIRSGLPLYTGSLLATTLILCSFYAGQS